MKRVLQVFLGLILALIILPPLWFAVAPGDPAPELAAAGTRLDLPGGGTLNVVEAGSGPPVVMVHGLPGSAYDWRETTSLLAKMGRRAIAYDRVGYGHSDPRSSGSYTTDSNADELLELLELMGLEDVTVAGWSYGGATAMVAAMKQGEAGRIGRIVLVGTGGPDTPNSEPPEASLAARFFYSDPVLSWRVAIPPLGVATMRLLSNAAYSDGPQPDWWLAGLRGNFSRWETLVTFREEMFGMRGGVSDWDPNKIQVPTLLLHGDDDRLAPISIGRYLVTAIPGAELVEYPGASHMLPVTHAKDLSERIVAFAN